MEKDEVNYTSTCEEVFRYKLGGALIKFRRETNKKETDLNNRRAKLWYPILNFKKQKEMDRKESERLANLLSQIDIERDKLEAGVQLFEQ